MQIAAPELFTLLRQQLNAVGSRLALVSGFARRLETVWIGDRQLLRSLLSDSGINQPSVADRLFRTGPLPQKPILLSRGQVREGGNLPAVNHQVHEKRQNDQQGNVENPAADGREKGGPLGRRPVVQEAPGTGKCGTLLHTLQRTKSPRQKEKEKRPRFPPFSSQRLLIA